MSINGNKDKIGTKCLLFTTLLFLLVLGRVLVLHSSELIERKRYRDPKISTNLIRGTIYDRNGNILAMQVPEYGFEINTLNPDYILSIISPYIELSYSDAYTRLVNGECYLSLSYLPNRDELESLEHIINSFEIADEVRLIKREERKYPSFVNTEELTGRTDSSFKGMNGIEALYDRELSAYPKLNGSTTQGSNIILTIDLNLQFATDLIPDVDERSDTLAIINSDGEILAYRGPINDELLSSLVMSIVREDSVDIKKHELSAIPFSSALLAADSYSRYFIYANSSDQKRTEAYLKSLRDVLYRNGKLKISD